MIPVTTRKQQQARLARKHRWALAVYFFTGRFPPATPQPRYQSSSDSITPRTIFICQQRSR